MSDQDGRSFSVVNSTIYVVVTGVLITVAGQWCINMLWPGTEPSEDIHELVRQSPISLTRWHDMTVNLNSAPETVREQLFKDYQGETVTWVGYYERYNVSSADNASSQTCVTLIVYDSLSSLNSVQPLGVPFVRCFFSRSQLPEISKLQRGQRIVVRGTLANPNLMGSILATDLNACELLAADDESRELAAVPGATLR